MTVRFEIGRIATVAGMATLAFLAAAGGPARAESPGPGYWLYDRSAAAGFQRGQFFAGFTLSGGVQHMPRFNGTQSVFSPFAPFPASGAQSFSPDLTGVQPGGEFGFAFRDGTLPDVIGQRFRVALFGSYAHAETRDSKGINPGPGGGASHVVRYFHVNGAFVSTGQTLPLATSQLVETLHLIRESYQIGLKAESDFALGPNLSLTPGLAIYGGHTTDTYDHTSINTFNGVLNSTPTALNERVRTNEIGGHVAMRVTWQFLPGWAMHVGGTAGVVSMRSRLDAQDCINGTFVAPGTPCGPSNGSFSAASASDSRSAVGFRGTASVGLATDLRIAVVSIGGFMRYDSRIPGVANPQLLGNFNTVPLAPARIRFDDGFAYGGFLQVRVPLF